MDVDLVRGRESFGRRQWAQAYSSLASADASDPLDVEDLELLSTAAYLVGRDDDYLRTLERAHRAYLEAGKGAPAARCAFWLGLRLLFRGEFGPATGWFGRARRLVEETTRDCVEQGYLMLPLVEQRMAAGDHAAAYQIACEAGALGARFADADLTACSIHLQGRALIGRQQAEQGLALLDEAMVWVTGGDLSAIMTGLVYCSVIDACQQVFAYSRAAEWTHALARWCADQPEMIAFTDRCLVHRSEIMQLAGAWSDAMAEAERASGRLGEGDDRRAAAAAWYQLGDLHRLRGEHRAAESAFRNANEWGREPQPGLTLLRLAQGRHKAAVSAIRRLLAATTEPLQRLRLLPAQVEIALAVDAIEDARSACAELEAIAEAYGTDMMRAIATNARGMVQLADGEPEAALASLQRARDTWLELGMPYLLACVRVDLGRACRALGDEEGAAMELDAAKAGFAQLGAAPDVRRVDALAADGTPEAMSGLTRRELQVLRLLASGRTNREIAAELSLSGRTIDRHVSSILGKLDVPSRAAATAFAYQHGLV